jgi:hypothetical protein
MFLGREQPPIPQTVPAVPAGAHTPDIIFRSNLPARSLGLGGEIVCGWITGLATTSLAFSSSFIFLTTLCNLQIKKATPIAINPIRSAGGICLPKSHAIKSEIISLLF